MKSREPGDDDAGLPAGTEQSDLELVRRAQQNERGAFDLLVAQMIRGKKVSTALADLEFSRKRIAQDVRKCVKSAIANAENNHNLDVDALIVKEASVGKAMTMKRFATRGRGKSTRILKPFSRLRIVVREVEEA